MLVGALIEPQAPGAAEFAVAAERIGVAPLWAPEVWVTTPSPVSRSSLPIPTTLDWEPLWCNWVPGAGLFRDVGAEPAEVFLGPIGEAVARRHADGYAFTIGAMSAGRGQERTDPGRYSGKNFYSDAFTRLGYGDAVRTVTELWKAHRREEARQAVPIDLGRLTNLLGTDDAVADRVARYRQAGITTPPAKLADDYADQLTTLERLIGIVARFLRWR